MGRITRPDNQITVNHMTKQPFRLALSVAILAGLPIALSTLHGVALQQGAASPRWVTAWGTSQQTLGMSSISNATVRMIARTTMAGEAVRLRLDNTYGGTPVTFGSVHVGQRVQGAKLAAGSNRRVLFKGAPTVTIAAGGSAASDPVPMNVPAGQDLAVSLFVAGSEVRPSQHTGALVTSYSSANGSGDVTADESRTPFTGSTTSTFWLKSIDVMSTTLKGTIVAFGDSITDGTCSTLDAHDRWVDWLATRIDLDDRRGAGDAAVRKAVVNEGIGGNTVGRENLQPAPDSTPGIERLERDVLSHHGVTDVIFFMGTNDIRREASAAQVIAGTEEIIKRVKAKGLRIFGVTIIPRHNVAGSGTNTGWNAAKTRIRHDVNQWTRTKAPFDGVIDFDSVVRDPANPDLIQASFNCDDIHPSPRGYYEMGKSISLELFRK
jgi:lysophospholipase L1-like esterase